ncbi:hypothetical protein M378DRAFT_591418 [Amanita muscaria Koide BX008]|uniref:Uncharacterized protein n=1 Tax=Amanita muscaria (strain Koide BX008) TaxID=946122 RepID=A0A0C2RYS1_AMAMK|nr:hypothetical protein M378DRAFT_591418 [Amanita muscaria Koide BX008]
MMTWYVGQPCPLFRCCRLRWHHCFSVYTIASPFSGNLKSSLASPVMFTTFFSSCSFNPSVLPFRYSRVHHITIRLNPNSPSCSHWLSAKPGAGCLAPSWPSLAYWVWGFYVLLTDEAP